MDKIHTLTVNGQTYTIEDPAAARINDSTVGSDAWSGKQIIDRLCPVFTKSGEIVTCKPVEGYPLSVVSHIKPVQSGSGDPIPASWVNVEIESAYAVSPIVLAATLTEGKRYRVTVESDTDPLNMSVEIATTGEPVEGAFNGNSFEFTMPSDAEVYIYADYDPEPDTVDFVFQEYDPGNVRPIAGFDSVQLTHENGEGSAQLSVDLGQTVGKGSYNWNTGVLTITHALIRLTSDMKWAMTGSSNPNGIRSFYVDKDIDNAKNSTEKYPVASSHYRFYESGWSVNSVTYENAIKILNSRIYLSDARFTDLASFKAFLAEETVQLMYPLVEPETYQLDPTQILSLSGENTLTSSTGDTEASGRLDIIPLLQTLI